MSFKDAMQEAARLSAQRHEAVQARDQEENLEVERLAKDLLTTLGILAADSGEELSVEDDYSDEWLKRKRVLLFLEEVLGVPVSLKITYSKEDTSYKPELIGYHATATKTNIQYMLPNPIYLAKDFDREEVLLVLYESWLLVKKYCVNVSKDRAQTTLNNRAGKDTKDKERAKSAGRLEKLSRIAASRQKSMQELVGEWVDSLEEEESTQGKSQLNNEQDPDAYWLLDTNRHCSEHLRYETEDNRKIGLFEKLRQILTFKKS